LFRAFFNTPNLETLDVSNNSLIELDLRTVKGLKELKCSNNPILEKDLHLNLISPPKHILGCPIKEPLSTSDKIALGTGIGIGVPTIILGIVSLVGLGRLRTSWRNYRR
jgi:hypothetical protein